MSVEEKCLVAILVLVLGASMFVSISFIKYKYAMEDELKTLFSNCVRVDENHIKCDITRWNMMSQIHK